MLKTKKDVTYGKTENDLLDKKESSKTITHKKCVPDNVCQTPSPFEKLEPKLQLTLKDIKDNERKKVIMHQVQWSNSFCF